LLSCFSQCLVNVLTRRTYFVMSVVNLPQVADKISIVKMAYELHFGCKVCDLDKSWAPHSCCSRWMRYLRSWLIGTHQSVPLTVPVVWREQKKHCIDCCFCLTKTDGHSSKSKHTLVDPNILQPYDLLNMTIPYQFLSHLNVGRCMKKNQQHLFRRRTWTFRFQCGYWYPATVPHLISQSELNDTVKDPNLSKIQAALMASRLQGWNLTQQGVKVS
jgi:hypothetical protein